MKRGVTFTVVMPLSLMLLLSIKGTTNGVHSCADSDGNDAYDEVNELEDLLPLPFTDLDLEPRRWKTEQE